MATYKSSVVDAVDNNAGTSGKANNTQKVQRVSEKQALQQINQENRRENANIQVTAMNELNKSIALLASKGIKLNDKQKGKLKEKSDKQAEQKQKQRELAQLKEAFATLKDAGASKEELAVIGRQIQESQGSFGDQLKNFASEMSSKLKDAFSPQNLMESAINAAGESINKTASVYVELQRGVNARMQGTEKTFAKMTNSLTGAIGTSPFVKQEVVLTNLKNAIDEGIAYNVEQRAFLQSVSENIASTFNAFDSNLTRLIKLQQADITASRLGSEAYLTNFLNRMFEDTSYLNQQYDNVTGALLEASATMSRDGATEFEFVVQKWLGSLSSVGLSDTAVQSLATAIGYLGSGNVSALNENETMQNLLVMAANRGGLDYADMLKDGLDASSTNTLMREIVEYVQEIAESDNQVVRSQYAQAFGMSASDLRAVRNLDNKALTDVSNVMMSYSGSIKELGSQMGQMYNRLHISQLVDNVVSNAMFGLGSTIVSNPATYALWQIADFIDQNAGGINIPSISVMGSGVDLEATVTQLMKLGVVGVSSLPMIGQIISGVAGAVNPEGILDRVARKTGAKEVREMGNTEGLTSRSAGMTTSSSAFVGNESGSDVYDSTIAETEQTKDQALENEKNEDEMDNKEHAAHMRAIDSNVAQIVENMSGSSQDQLLAELVINTALIESYLDGVVGNTPTLKVLDALTGKEKKEDTPEIIQNVQDVFYNYKTANQNEGIDSLISDLNNTQQSTIDAIQDLDISVGMSTGNLSNLITPTSPVANSSVVSTDYTSPVASSGVVDSIYRPPVVSNNTAAVRSEPAQSSTGMNPVENSPTQIISDNVTTLVQLVQAMSNGTALRVVVDTSSTANLSGF